MRRLQAALAVCSGGLLVALAVLTVVSRIHEILLDWPLLIRSVWNLLFGILLMVMQLRRPWIDRQITKNFGLLDSRIGRAFFFLFVGQNGLVEFDLANLVCLLSLVVCGACWLCGLIELCCRPRALPTVPSAPGDNPHPAADSRVADGVAPLCQNVQDLGSLPSSVVPSAASIWASTVAAASGGSDTPRNLSLIHI